jgi:hypothetical protein
MHNRYIPVYYNLTNGYPNNKNNNNNKKKNNKVKSKPLELYELAGKNCQNLGFLKSLMKTIPYQRVFKRYTIQAAQWL